MAGRPVLLVEGEGDRAAAPDLVVKVARWRGNEAFFPMRDPIITRALPQVLRQGQLERLATHALHRPGDGAIWILDCDDGCAVEKAREFCQRLEPIARAHRKPVALCFMVREFEALFLADFPGLFERIGDMGRGASEFDPSTCENLRDAKVKMRQIMGSAYREMRHQQVFTKKLNVENAASQSRSLRHLAAAVEWYSSDEKNELVYPNIS